MLMLFLSFVHKVDFLQNDMQAKILCLLALTSFASAFPSVSTSNPTPTVSSQNSKRLDTLELLTKNKDLSPPEAEKNNQETNLIEVKEDEIPEGSLVYVLEEPIDQPVDGELLKTADNIVFRPLFRYRSKQEAQRRNSNRIRRRYFIPNRVYRQSYYYRPSYFNRRYYG